MGFPYSEPTITNYNANPPASDGSQTEANRIKWETIKSKLPDPLKAAMEADFAETLAAFGRVLGGGGVVTSGISATVSTADQGKLFRATASGITITTPDATDVDEPFVFGFLNSSTGTVTLDGNGSQTINGVASIVVPVGGGGIVFTDGSNWFLAGLGGVLAGKQLGAGDIINGTITESNGSNAVTFALKTLAGNNPSTDDPVLVCFRNPTAGTGNYVYRSITTALSLTIPSSATMGAVNAVSFNIEIVLFDAVHLDGAVYMGVVNPTNLAIAKSPPIASATAMTTGADSANVFYASTGLSSLAYVPVAVARYASGLTTAGSWNVSPTTLQLRGHGAPAPAGPTRQILTSGTGATYTTPTGCRQIIVRMVGGGGGGGGGTAGGTDGGNGGATSFESWSAGAGAGGAKNTGTPGAGGSGGSTGSGTLIQRITGARGGQNGQPHGGGGGSSQFALMAATGTVSTAGDAGPTNTGAGGGGGSSGVNSGSGGGAGEYVKFYISAPAATYTYTIGAGGTAGAAGGSAGGAGGSGVILVDEYY